MSTGSRRIKLLAAFLTALPLIASEVSGDVRAAEDLLGKGEYQKAIKTLNRALAHNPREEPEVYVMLAVAKLNMEDRLGALVSAEQGLKVFPDSARIANYYVELLPSVVTASEVAKNLEGMLRLQPNSAILRKALGKALMARNKDDTRLSGLLTGAAAALPQDAEAQYLLGKWACLHEQEQRCIALLQRSLDLSPPDNYAATLLLNGLKAAAYDRQGESVDARMAFEQAFAAYSKLNPPVADVPFQFAKFLIAAGDSGRASEVISEILRLNPEFGAAHLEIAKLLFQEGSHERAAAEANTALSLAAHDQAATRAVHVFLVKVNSAMGHEAEAEMHRRWVDANP